MQKMKIAKKYGEWFYNKIFPDCYNDLDAPIYELYKMVDGKPEYEKTFGCYGDMKYYAQTGICLF